MHSFVKGTFIFAGGLIGGFCLGSAVTVCNGLKNGNIREAVIKNISDKIGDILYGDKANTKVSHTNHSPSFKYRIDEIVFNTLEDGEEILTSMKNILESYGSVRVIDVYDLCGLNSTFADSKIGWINVDDFEVLQRENGDGYYLKGPLPDKLS